MWWGRRIFYKDGHRRIFEAILELYGKNEPVDLLTVGNRLEEKGRLDGIGGRSYLAELVNTVPTASNVASYASIGYRKAVRRRLLGAANEISRLGFEENDDLEKTLDDAQKHLLASPSNTLNRLLRPSAGF